MSDAWGGSFGMPSAWAESWAASEAEASTPASGGGIARKRRRYIMPDGTMLEATTQEAYEWLRLYARPAKVPAPTAKASPQRTVLTPQVVLEKRDVRFIPATDSAPDTWKAIISERFTFQAPPDVTRQAQERLNRIRAANNAALIALLM